MNTLTIKYAREFSHVAAVFIISVVAAFVITSCATTPKMAPGAAEVRTKLTELKSNPQLADQAPVEIREAEAAVLTAEQPVGTDAALSEHRVYMADRKVEIAMANASTRYAEGQRAVLSQKRDDVRLDARTREADQAQRRAAESESASEAASAAAVVAAADAASNEAELQRQIDLLEAEATDRGLVLTLGDVLFATGRSDLKPGRNNTLDKLVVFLNEYPDRNAAIEGHTDDVGSLEMNQVLSQQRADSVKSYIVQQGIQSGRLVASGMGETQPIADNQSASGRQQNRRVEVIIKNSPSISPTASTR
jgi:outer membrane protein OmpA-like peptidoglycan-associated protein